jgi:hypothetical protein
MDFTPTSTTLLISRSSAAESPEVKGHTGISHWHSISTWCHNYFCFKDQLRCLRSWLTAYWFLGQEWWFTPVIPGTWEVEIWRNHDGGQPGQKLGTNKVDHGGICLSSLLCRKYKLEDYSPSQLRAKMWDPILKITKTKRTGGMAQVVRYLPH